MGVRGLWKILEPTAQPVQLESLRGKILAIDASIWIYHFLKAMRDSKGTVLAAAHVIGFFRRICKLLFYEIKPVFVFDGAPPILKKETTSKRNERRVNREQSARSAANKLLTLQLQRLQNEGTKENKQSQNRVVGEMPEHVVYLEDLESSTSNVDQQFPEAPSASVNVATTSYKPFIKTDQYHLPEMGQIAPIRSDDQRMLTQDELDEYAKQFTNQARGGFIDTSLVDFKSKEFERLPIETQYQLINMARMKSRLRMGFTADELNKMFPNEMEFSKFQINRVAQRNFFTQKLMNLVGLEEDLTRRISSAKDKEYFLKRTTQGWSLSLEGNETDEGHHGGPKNQDVTAAIKDEVKNELIDEDEDDSEFEDVDIDVATPEKIDLTAEESAKIDELFGFEAQITRQNVYDRLMDEAGIEKPENSNKSIMSMLFDENNDTAEQDNMNKTAPMNHQETVPWFANQEFQSMEIPERADPNFIDINLLSGEPKIAPNPNYNQDRQIQDVSPLRVLEPLRDDTGVNATIPEDIAQPQDVLTVFKNEKASSKSPGEASDVKESSSESPHPQPAEESTSEREAIIPKKHPGEESETAIDSHEVNVGHGAYNKSVIEHNESEHPDGVLPSNLQSPLPTDLDHRSTFPEPHSHVRDNLREKSPAEDEKPNQSFPEDIERAEEEARDSEEENENIAGMLVAEAEENERFARTLAENTNHIWTSENQQDYDNQISQLRKQFAKNTRDSEGISTDMIQECQELLQLFGIPYITAPAEAEAQCAELRHLKLVDGVVTDDGDTFLFDDDAAVYRNMFSQAKFVEYYSTKQIRQTLGLDRLKLIDLAFLLGSDYTEGILGIGPVTGVEIIAEFGDLKKFAEWWNEAQRFPDDVDVTTSLRRRLLKQFKSRLFLPDDFPREAVVQAYLNPVVDKDNTKFSWGIPDLDNIRKMLSITAGWSSEKVNSVILPVVQETKRRELQRKTLKSFDQSHINDYYTSVVQNPSLGSKRTNKAVQSLRKRTKKD